MSEELIKKEALEKLSKTDKLNPIEGWIDVGRDKLSYQGVLYKESYRFQVKPCNAGLLKYFSTLDEDNPISIQDALTYVIKNHIRIWDGNVVLDSYNTVHEHDRFYFTMLVHNYSGAPTDLKVEVTSPHDTSGKKQVVNITPYNLVFKELTEKGMSYLNTKEGYFDVKTKTLGDWKYRPLNCTESLELTQFMIQQQKEGTPIENFFLRCAGFFVWDVEKFDSMKVYQNYLRATSDMKVSSMLVKAIEHIEPELKLEISAVCGVTKKPFQAPITTLRGIKDIFLVSDSESELQ